MARFLCCFSILYRRSGFVSWHGRDRQGRMEGRLAPKNDKHAKSCEFAQAVSGWQQRKAVWVQHPHFAQPPDGFSCSQLLTRKPRENGTRPSVHSTRGNLNWARHERGQSDKQAKFHEMPAATQAAEPPGHSVTKTPRYGERRHSTEPGSAARGLACCSRCGAVTDIR
ncbi:hypothetical protein VTK26DRAFT_870 [Humicola hyalothermophila]